MATARLHFAEDERLAALRSHAILDTPPDSLFDNLPRSPRTSVAPLLLRWRWWTPDRAVVQVDCRARRLEVRSLSTALSPPMRSRPLGHSSFRCPLQPALRRQPSSDGGAGNSRLRRCPLIGRDGLPLGALCVIDRQPRTFDARALELLTVLADQVVLLLEAHRPKTRQTLFITWRRSDFIGTRPVAGVSLSSWNCPIQQAFTDRRLDLPRRRATFVWSSTWSGLATSAAVNTSQHSVFALRRPTPRHAIGWEPRNHPRANIN